MQLKIYIFLLTINNNFFTLEKPDKVDENSFKFNYQNMKFILLLVFFIIVFF